MSKFHQENQEYYADKEIAYGFRRGALRIRINAEEDKKDGEIMDGLLSLLESLRRHYEMLEETKAKNCNLVGFIHKEEAPIKLLFSLELCQKRIDRVSSLQIKLYGEILSKIIMQKWTSIQDYQNNKKTNISKVFPELFPNSKAIVMKKRIKLIDDFIKDYQNTQISEFSKTIYLNKFEISKTNFGNQLNAMNFWNAFWIEEFITKKEHFSKAFEASFRIRFVDDNNSSEISQLETKEIFEKMSPLSTNFEEYYEEIEEEKKSTEELDFQEEQKSNHNTFTNAKYIVNSCTEDSIQANSINLYLDFPPNNASLSISQNRSLYRSKIESPIIEIKISNPVQKNRGSVEIKKVGLIKFGNSINVDFRISDNKMDEEQFILFCEKDDLIQIKSTSKIPIFWRIPLCKNIIIHENDCFLLKGQEKSETIEIVELIIAKITPLFNVEDLIDPHSGKKVKSENDFFIKIKFQDTYYSYKNENEIFIGKKSEILSIQNFSEDLSEIYFQIVYNDQLGWFFHKFEGQFNLFLFLNNPNPNIESEIPLILNDSQNWQLECGSSSIEFTLKDKSLS